MTSNRQKTQYYCSSMLTKNNKAEVPIAITSINGYSSDRRRTYQFLSEDEPAFEYSEMQNPPFKLEQGRSLNLRHSTMNRTNNNGISHPTINTNPISQHGAVKAVNIFGTLHQEPLKNMSKNDKSAVIHPKFSKGRKKKKILSFQRNNKSRINPLLVTGNSSYGGYKGTNQNSTHNNRRTKSQRIHGKNFQEKMESEGIVIHGVNKLKSSLDNRQTQN